jgi:hypothetical protein
MEIEEFRLVNEAGYRKLKPYIDQTFPKKHFVAIDKGELVGNATDFWVLYNTLVAEGRDPLKVLVVQVGKEYPDYAVIL